MSEAFDKPSVSVIITSLDGVLTHIDFNRLSDDQLARIAAGEHVLSVLGTATQPVAALTAGE